MYDFIYQNIFLIGKLKISLLMKRRTLDPPHVSVEDYVEAAGVHIKFGAIQTNEKYDRHLDQPTFDALYLSPVDARSKMFYR
jgi:hypothetical protein